MNRLLGLWMACCTLLVLPAQAQKPSEINFGVISTESSQALKESWQPFLADMEKAIGMKVNAFFASDYGGIIEGMRFNKVQIAWHGNKSAMEAVDRANSEVFVRVVYKDGTMGYHSYMVAHKDSPLNSVEDLLKTAKSLTFGIGEPNSTSGFLVPSYYVFALNKVDPKTAFKSIRGANHETNILAVANKQIDASVFASDAWDRVSARRPEIAAQLKRIWTSPLIPSDPMVWRKDLDPEVKRKVKAFFLTYGKSDSKQKEVLAKLNYSAFVESNNDQLKPIRQLEFFRERTRIAGDDRMPATEKQAKLAELDRKLAELN